MSQKSLAELRRAWRRQALKDFLKHMPAVLVAALLGAAMARAMFADVSSTVIPGSPMLTYMLAAPYWAYVAVGILAGAVLTVPLVLTCLGPYPSKRLFELNVQILEARAAARAPAGSEEA